ncbi:MAG: Nitrite reductase (NAD(P)H) [Pelotomaculum sp. PtaU1.Bin035]|nr:MAG: Nitrite reductase (NAD(P)H) [Pelotomaculum sp. PtaU1.Bin035]
MPEQKNPRGAFIQRDKTTYAIVPRTPVGLVTPEFLENVARVAKKHEIPIIKITSGQRLALVGLKPEIIDDVWADLGMDAAPAVGLCVHYVKACPGTEVCRFGVRDSLGLGLRLEKLLVGVEMPGKVKIGVSGCPNNCSEAYVRDIGLFGKAKGWTLIIGGTSARKPRIGDVIAEQLTDDQAVELVQKHLEYYKNNAKPKERTARFIERIGIEAFKNAVLG